MDTKIKITLVDDNEASFELEVEYSLIAEANVIEYKKSFYVYKPSTLNPIKPRFIQIASPVFIA